VRKRPISSKLSSLYVRGAPPGPAGNGGGQRRCARRTARRHTSTLTHLLGLGNALHYIYALRTSDGSLLWRYQTGAAIDSSPAVVNGVLFIGSTDHYLYALQVKDGSLLWRYQAHDSIMSSPLVT